MSQHSHIKKILIAYDGSPGAEGALLDLVRSGLPQQALVKVLAIADVWIPPDASKNEPAFPDRVSGARIKARHEAMEMLLAARDISKIGAERLHSLFPKWTIEHTAHADSPAWGILAEARKWHADLIVLGSHGRSILQKIFLGSVCQKVAAEAPCSIRIFRPHHRKDDATLRILAAIDGSEDSEGAVAELLSRKWAADTRFMLATVIDPKLQTALLYSDIQINTGLPAATAQDRITEILARQTDLFRQKNRFVESRILDGDPKQVILNLAEEWKSDAIFIGARGLNHGDRLYLGTVASAIAARAHCAVELVRPAIVSAVAHANKPLSELAPV